MPNCWNTFNAKRRVPFALVVLATGIGLYILSRRQMPSIRRQQVKTKFPVASLESEMEHSPKNTSAITSDTSSEVKLLTTQPNSQEAFFRLHTSATVNNAHISTSHIKRENSKWYALVAALLFCGLTKTE